MANKTQARSMLRMFPDDLPVSAPIILKPGYQPAPGKCRKFPILSFA